MEGVQQEGDGGEQEISLRNWKDEVAFLGTHRAHLHGGEHDRTGVHFGHFAVPNMMRNRSGKNTS